MCKQCSDPLSPQGKAVRSYFESQGKAFKYTKRTESLKALDDPFIVGNPHFTAELDTMPDGVHAKPRHMWRKVYDVRHRNIDSGILGTKRDCEALEKEYSELPEPKPDYLEWASGRMRKHLFRQLITMSKNTQKGATAVRAIGTLLEFTKSKPKQEIEMTNKDFSGELPDLFRQLCTLGGVPPEATETFVASYFGKPNPTN